MTDDVTATDDVVIETTDSTILDNITPLPDTNTPWKSTLGSAFACFFVVIATVLGTGILALPVKVGDTGFGPFVLNFFICFLAQAFILIYMVELLQKTNALMTMQQNEAPPSQDESLEPLQEEHTSSEPGNTQQTETDHDLTIDDEPMDEIELEDANEKQETQEEAPPKIELKEPQAGTFLSHGPDLHTMGKFFLNKWMQVIFDGSVLLHFISILISYSLAGPSSYSKLVETLLNIGKPTYNSFASTMFQYLIAPYIIVWALVVVFLSGLITKIISIATLVKGALLVVMVALTGIVSIQVQQGFSDHWQYIGRPFLIGTVALGGAMNTLPVIYSRMVPTKRNLNWFRWSAVSALLVCFVLNVLWCLFVLLIVPQTAEDADAPSLARARREEEISIVPVIEIINTRFPQYTWLGIFVQVFISISITVSFITMSTGMKHMLDGYVKTFSAYQAKQGSYIQRFSRFLISKSRVLWFLRVEQEAPKRVAMIFQFVLYFICFLLVYICAQVNYKGFLSIMEIFTSLALNLESGFFVAFMLWQSRKAIYSTPTIQSMMLLPLPKWVIHTLWAVGAYFLFAVVYDIVYTILRLALNDIPF